MRVTLRIYKLSRVKERHILSKIIIIGGGAAGMMSAIVAARQKHQVTIIEQQSKLGRKILSTGNGRCNFTNEMQNPSCYRSSNPDFPFGVIEQFPFDDTIEFFKELGVYPKSREGYIYPNSDQATSVVDTMMMELKKLKVEILLNTRCEIITLHHPSHFSILIKNLEEASSKSEVATFKTGTFHELYGDKVILTTGGKAAPVLGSDGSGYDLAKSLGHRIVPVFPSLVQLRCQESFYKQLAGLRMEGRVSIHVGERKVAEDTGEIQLTDYGISGIPVFQVSGIVAQELSKRNNVLGVLNFMPQLSREEVVELLNQRVENNPDKKIGEFFIGLFPKKFGDLLVKLCELCPKEKVSHLKKHNQIMISKMAEHITAFETKIIATNSFEQAQVCSGGVDTREINPGTMESLLAKNLYFAGEVVDVDGICGGYNLQWAWSSGFIAGSSAAKECTETNDEKPVGNLL